MKFEYAIKIIHQILLNFLFHSWKLISTSFLKFHLHVMLVFCVSHVGLKIPLFFNAYIYTILGLRVKISHVTKDHHIIGGMNFPSHKLSLYWFIVLANPMFSYYKSWMIFGIFTHGIKFMDDHENSSNFIHECSSMRPITKLSYQVHFSFFSIPSL
jgi:hypothetical protein